MTNRFSKSELTVRHAVQSQIPSFYNVEGEGFVLFMEKYFQHLEDDVLSVGRNLQNSGDIDATADEFLINFNNKYTFGQGRSIRNLPSVVTGDLRFIIKHIKDIYRSKGTDRGIKLFFRVAFNDSPEIFTPGTQLFRPSDSTFRRPVIIEVDNGIGAGAAPLAGSRIIGSLSGARASVQDVYVKRVGEKEFTYMNLDNITGSFITGDKITTVNPTADAIVSAPTVTGPVDGLIIEDGSVGIPEGTVFTSQDGRELKVSADEFEFLTGTFQLAPVEGTKYSNKSSVIITRAPLEDDEIERGSFEVLVDDTAGQRDVTGTLISSLTGSTAINNMVHLGSVIDLNDPIEDIFNIETEAVYGDIVRVRTTNTPQLYSKTPFVRIEDVSFSSNQTGTIAVSGTTVTGTSTVFDNLIASQPGTGTIDVTFGNTTITGSGTAFTTEFEANDVIRTEDANGGRYLTIKSIASDTELTVMESPDFVATGAPVRLSHQTYIKIFDSLGNETLRVVNNSTSNTALTIDDDILDSDGITETTGLTFAVGYSSDRNFDRTKFGPTVGQDADFTTKIIAGSGSVKGVQILNTGYGYEDGEKIVLLSEDLTPEMSITHRTGRGAAGFLQVANDGSIERAVVTSGGSGYDTAPTIAIVGGTGSGAIITAEVTDGVVSNLTVTNGGSGYNLRETITVEPVKGGQAKLEGQTIRKASEPSSGLVVQDSDFWQEYSYEIQSSIDGSQYEDTVKGLMHMSGRKIFTKVYLKDDLHGERSSTGSITAS